MDHVECCVDLQVDAPGCIYYDYDDAGHILFNTTQSSNPLMIFFSYIHIYICVTRKALGEGNFHPMSYNGITICTAAEYRVC